MAPRSPTPRRPTSFGKLGYSAAQGARVAWYLGHYLAANRVRGPLTSASEKPFRPRGGIPERARLMAGMRALFEQDWRNIEAGLYRAPPALPADLKAALTRSVLFFRDVPALDRRRMARGHSDVLTPDRQARYPRYYLQNFHYQTDGWLSDHSAKIYDTQVETLFTGAADAMRRQALVPLRAATKGRDQRKLHLLDLACGTGRFLARVKENYPRLNVTGLDLSAAYLAEAKRTLAAWRGCAFLEANAEHVPLENASQDVISCIYLFHELPPRIRRIVVSEIARLLKPGGTLIFQDALQTGDREDYDGLLEFFPVGFHEPYFSSYLTEDFASLFRAQGLEWQTTTPAFLSKVMVFKKINPGD